MNRPILGLDFLAAHDLLIDPRHGRLLHRPTSSVIPTKSCIQTTALLIHLRETYRYDAVLKDFTLLTSPRTSNVTVLHQVQHTITSSGLPCFAWSHPLPPERLQAAQKEFELLLREGIIRPSDSCWASPLHLVPKVQDEEWRACGDYRALNAMTRPDRYLIPHVLDFHSKLHRRSVFSKIDLLRAYHQIPVADEDVQKTAVTTPFGLFEYPGI